jgi:predicted Zn-dependent protease with MMP-like domain
MEDSLAVMRRRKLDLELQTMLAEVALRSWRRLPRDFHPEFGEGLLRIAAAANNLDSAAVGGPVFGLLTQILGVQLAARVLRFRAGPYQNCRTMSDEEWTRLYAEFRARDDQKLSASY